MGPRESVTLSRTASWKATSTPSAVACTSVSRYRYPSLTARRNAGSVFSRPVRSPTCHPRCAKARCPAMPEKPTVRVWQIPTGHDATAGVGPCPRRLAALWPAPRPPPAAPTGYCSGVSSSVTLTNPGGVRPVGHRAVASGVGVSCLCRTASDVGGSTAISRAGNEPTRTAMPANVTNCPWTPW